MHNSDSVEVKELVAPGDLNVSSLLLYSQHVRFSRRLRHTVCTQFLRKDTSIASYSSYPPSTTPQPVTTKRQQLIPQALQPLTLPKKDYVRRNNKRVSGTQKKAKKNPPSEFPFRVPPHAPTTYIPSTPSFNSFWRDGNLFSQSNVQDLFHKETVVWSLRHRAVSR